MVRLEHASSTHTLVRTVLLLCLLGSAVGGVVAMPSDTHRSVGPSVDGSTAPLAQENSTGITKTTLSGPGIALRDDTDTENATIYVWQNDSVVVGATMVPIDKAGDHDLCVAVRDDEGTATSERCRTVDVPETGTRSQFELDPITANGTGPHTIELTLSDFDDTRTTRLEVVVIARDGDLDSDSLNNSQEIKRGTGLEDSDTDSDGLLDGLELTKYGSFPKRADSDRDGLRDGREIDVGTKLRDPDTDDDGLTDGEEVNEYGTDPLEVDSDDDGLNDAHEISIGTDPNVNDTDTDGLDDARELELGTDPTDPDTDDDGIDDGTEVDREMDPLSPSSSAPGPIPGGGWPLSGRDTMVAVVAGTILVGVAVVANYVRQREADTPAPPEPASAPVSDDEDEEAVDTDLLSPEQHVMHLLEANGGRMKQSSFVEETGWSKAKVSRKLSRLEEAGEIKRVRIGRENVVTYPDRELGDES